MCLLAALSLFRPRKPASLFCPELFNPKVPFPRLIEQKSSLLMDSACFSVYVKVQVCVIRSYCVVS